MRIKEVEELVGITRKNIRFYEKENLLSPGRELENSYRDYTFEDIRRLQIIKLLRKLDMPISSIRDVLELRISLREAVHLHSLLLEEQRVGIENAQRVCHKIQEDGAELADLDTEHYLDEILHAEKDSTMLVNIRRKDTVRKYQESVTVTVLIIAILLSFAGFVYYFHQNGALSREILIILAAVFLVILVGVSAALFTRIKEIRKGEEDDLSQY